MVKTNFFYKDNNIVKVEINGHANFDKLGKDIVCAGISTIVFGTLNALDNLVAHSEVKLTLEDANSKITIEVLQVTNINQTILKTMLWQLKTISEKYRKNIVIQEVY